LDVNQRLLDADADAPDALHGNVQIELHQLLLDGLPDLARAGRDPTRPHPHHDHRVGLKARLRRTARLIAQSNQLRRVSEFAHA
jgi:hypothetical protein